MGKLAIKLQRWKNYFSARPHSAICLGLMLIWWHSFETDEDTYHSFYNYALEHTLSPEIAENLMFYLYGTAFFTAIEILFLVWFAVKNYKYTHFYLIILLWINVAISYGFTKYIVNLVNAQSSDYLYSLNMRWILTIILSAYLLWQYFSLKKPKNPA